MFNMAKNQRQRDFEAEIINQKWCTDITCIHVLQEGWTCLAFVMDLCSRKIIGYAYSIFIFTPIKTLKKPVEQFLNI